jgi:hypothetical protein
MAEDFTTKPTAAEAEAIADCKDPRHLYELLQANAAASRAVPQETPAAVAAPPIPAERVRHNSAGYFQVVYPNGNDRFEVTADSEEELQKKIERIRAMYR